MKREHPIVGGRTAPALGCGADFFASIFGAFTHAFQGAPAARRVLRGVLAGSYAFAVFFLTISGLINNVGIASAFALATLAAFVVQGSSLWLLQRY